MDEIDKQAWEAVSAALDELLEADESERAARLEQLQEQNPAVAAQVIALLAQQPAVAAEHFLEGMALDPTGLATLAGRSHRGND